MGFWNVIFGAKKAIWSAMCGAWLAFVSIVAALPPGVGLESIPLIAWLGIISILFGLPGGTYFLANRQTTKSNLAADADELLKAAQEAVK